MKSLLLALALTSSSVFAIDLVDLEAKYCGHSVEQNGSNLRTYPLFYDITSDGEYFIQNQMIEGRRVNILHTPNYENELPARTRSLQDFKVIDKTIFILTKNSLGEFDKDGYILNWYPIPQSSMAPALGFSFHPAQNALYLAQGKLGIRKFNLSTKTFKHTYPLNTTNEESGYSKAISVAEYDNLLYVVMATRTQDAFNGVVVFDPQKVEIINKAKYDRRRAGVVGVDARVYVSQDRVVLNNSGWIHNIDRQDVLRKKTIRPHWNAISMTQENYKQYIMLSGDLIFNGDGVLGCGRYRTLNNTFYGKAFSTSL